MFASAKEAHAQVVAERKKFEFDAQQWKDRARKYPRPERRGKNQRSLQSLASTKSPTPKPKWPKPMTASSK